MVAVALLAVVMVVLAVIVLIIRLVSDNRGKVALLEICAVEVVQWIVLKGILLQMTRNGMQLTASDVKRVFHGGAYWRL